MGAEGIRRADSAFGVLQQLARRRAPGEQCEFCARNVATPHDHLIEPATRRLVCACGACVVLFSGAGDRFKRVPRLVRALPQFRISRAQWESLLIPIDIAFFFTSSQAGRTLAIYPSPAGPTESLLPLATWDDIVKDQPALQRMQPDVEALIVDRLASGAAEPRDAGGECFLVPIDECFRLVGLIRLHWKGLSGGTEVWREIGHFFSEMRLRANGASEVPRA